MNTQNNDEIDLLELIKSIFKFLIKNKVIIGISLISGLAFGVFNVKTNTNNYKPTYAKQFIAFSPVVSNNLLIQILENFNYKLTHRSKENLNSLVTDFNIDKNIINGINKFEVNDEILLAPSKSEGGGIQFTLTTINEEYFDMVVAGIVHNVKNNQFINERFSFINKQYEEQLSLIDIRIDSIEVEQVRRRQNSEISSDSKYINNLNKTSKLLSQSKYIISVNTPNEFEYQLIKEKQLLIKERILISSLINKDLIKFIDTSAPTIYQDGKFKKVITVLQYSFFGFFLGIIISLFFMLRKSR